MEILVRRGRDGTIGQQGREDKAREDLLKADNEGEIRSEIAYRRFTNSSPHTHTFILYCIK